MPQNRLDVRDAAGLRVKVARVSDECGVHKRLDGGAATTAGGGQVIGGEPPARVERHAEGADQATVDQRLEAGLRGDGVDGLGARDQARGIARRGYRETRPVRLEIAV